MSESASEWTIEQLRAAVDAPSGLAPARPGTIMVERLDRSGRENDGVVADIEVRDPDGVQRWRLTFDSMWADVFDFPLPDAALMVRTNIVEWWDTHTREPDPPWLTSERLG